MASKYAGEETSFAIVTNDLGQYLPNLRICGYPAVWIGTKAMIKPAPSLTVHIIQYTGPA